MSAPTTLRPAVQASRDAMDHVRLGKSGLKISRIVLGAMSFGTPTDQMGWTLKEDEALPILKHALDMGMNTWDTADIYSYGDSERIVGKALKEYDIPREKVVIMSKCGGGVPYPGEFDGLSDMDRLIAQTINGGKMVNRLGLSRKHVFDAVDASVARLGTYIDVLQVHRLDRDTPPEEVMKALNDVVESGKVRYLGASSMYAWEFQRLNNIAERNGWHKFISMQDYHSMLHREEEREMLPYCQSAGIGLIPWSPLARGLLARPYDGANKTARQETDSVADMLIGPVTDADVAIIGRVQELAKAKGCSMAQISMLWSLQKGFNPIIGINKKERVDEAVEAVALHHQGLLEDADIRYLDELYIPKTPLTHAW